MAQTVHTIIPNLIEQHYQRLLDGFSMDGSPPRNGWDVPVVRSPRIVLPTSPGASSRNCARASPPVTSTISPGRNSTLDLLNTVAAERAVSGFSPSETAVFVFSLKEPLFEILREEITDVGVLARET